MAAPAGVLATPAPPPNRFQGTPWQTESRWRQWESVFKNGRRLFYKPESGYQVPQDQRATWQMFAREALTATSSGGPLGNTTTRLRDARSHGEREAALAWCTFEEFPDRANGFSLTEQWIQSWKNNVGPTLPDLEPWMNRLFGDEGGADGPGAVKQRRVNLQGQRRFSLNVYAGFNYERFAHAGEVHDWTLARQVFDLSDTGRVRDVAVAVMIERGQDLEGLAVAARLTKSGAAVGGQPLNGSLLGQVDVTITGQPSSGQGGKDLVFWVVVFDPTSKETNMAYALGARQFTFTTEPDVPDNAGTGSGGSGVSFRPEDVEFMPPSPLKITVGDHQHAQAVTFMNRGIAVVNFDVGDLHEQAARAGIRMSNLKKMVSAMGGTSEIRSLNENTGSVILRQDEGFAADLEFDASVAHEYVLNFRIAPMDPNSSNQLTSGVTVPYRVDVLPGAGGEASAADAGRQQLNEDWTITENKGFGSVHPGVPSQAEVKLKNTALRPLLIRPSQFDPVSDPSFTLVSINKDGFNRATQPMSIPAGALCVLTFHFRAGAATTHHGVFELVYDEPDQYAGVADVNRSRGHRAEKRFRVELTADVSNLRVAPLPTERYVNRSNFADDPDRTGANGVEGGVVNLASNSVGLRRLFRFRHTQHPAEQLEMLLEAITELQWAGRIGLFSGERLQALRDMLGEASALRFDQFMTGAAFAPLKGQTQMQINPNDLQWDELIVQLAFSALVKENPEAKALAQAFVLMDRFTSQQNASPLANIFGQMMAEFMRTETAGVTYPDTSQTLQRAKDEQALWGKLHDKIFQLFQEEAAGLPTRLLVPYGWITADERAEQIRQARQSGTQTFVVNALPGQVTKDYPTGAGVWTDIVPQVVNPSQLNDVTYPLPAAGGARGAGVASGLAAGSGSMPGLSGGTLDNMRGFSIESPEALAQMAGLNPLQRLQFLNGRIPRRVHDPGNVGAEVAAIEEQQGMRFGRHKLAVLPPYWVETPQHNLALLNLKKYSEIQERALEASVEFKIAETRDRLFSRRREASDEQQKRIKRHRINTFHEEPRARKFLDVHRTAPMFVLNPPDLADAHSILLLREGMVPRNV